MLYNLIPSTAHFGKLLWHLNLINPFPNNQGWGLPSAPLLVIPIYVYGNIGSPSTLYLPWSSSLLAFQKYRAVALSPIHPFIAKVRWFST